jgi:hypothetical protein
MEAKQTTASPFTAAPSTGGFSPPGPDVRRDRTVGAASGGGTYTAAASSAGAAASSSRSAATDPAVPTPGEALGNAQKDLREIADYASYYLSAKIDSILLVLRNIGVYAALGVAGLVVGMGVLLTAGAVLVIGIADGLGQLLWHQYWAGQLLTGFLILGAIALGAYIFMTRLTKSSRLATLSKYAKRREEQTSQFGTNVKERAHGNVNGQ